MTSKMEEGMLERNEKMLCIQVWIQLYFPLDVHHSTLSKGVSSAYDISNFKKTEKEKKIVVKFCCYIWNQHDKYIKMSTNKPSVV